MACRRVGAGMARPLPVEGRVPPTPCSMRISLQASAALILAVALTSCQAEDGVVMSRSASVARAQVAPPLPLEGSAWDAAGEFALPAVPPGNYPGLQNVYRFSDRIITGSEPVDREALAQLGAWGVKTIFSVDGKAPDVEGAEELGLRYVHVPIQYKGITDDQVLQIAKAFREYEAPFYVHCFHGRHRGPAAAAIGSVALDGLNRDRAIAEMRHWCTTAKKYEGLYLTVATAEFPTAEETAAYDFDFLSAQRFSGLREAMVTLTRSWDEVKLIRKNGWVESQDHPDIDPLRSASTVLQHLDACSEMDETATFADDFRAWLTDSREGTGRLVELLTDCRSEPGVDRSAELELAYDAVAESCLECHSVYRNR